MNERNALIVWGGWEGHQPDQCAAIVEKFLVEDGFRVTKGESNRGLWRSGSRQVRFDHSDL